MSPLHVSTDQSELDVALIHRSLAQHSVWARYIPLALVQRAIANALCLGRFLKGEQVAFAGVVFATKQPLPIWAICSCCQSTRARAMAR